MRQIVTSLRRKFRPTVISHRISHYVSNHVVDKTPITSQLWRMRQQVTAKETNINAHKVASILEKTVKDSRLSITYPFKNDDNLRDMYIDHKGHLLIGKLFEDLDAFAGNIAHDHCDDNDPETHRLSLVTASVDEILMKRPISVKNDINIVGQVAWVGNSSLDVVVEIHQLNSEETDASSCLISDSKLLSSFFTYVARDKQTGRAAPVNKLVFDENNHESAHIRLFEERKRIAAERKIEKKKSITEPAVLTLEETAALNVGNALNNMPAVGLPDAVLMRNTSFENTFVCQPQNVNTAGRVFGGFLMHKAYDLALATGYTFAGACPVFQETDMITFQRPVEIGDMVRLTSRVVISTTAPVWPTLLSKDNLSVPSPALLTAETVAVLASSEPRVVVDVTVEVIKPEQASSTVSNTFTFVFGFDNLCQTLRPVLPSSGDEAQSQTRSYKIISDLVSIMDK